MRLGCWAIAIGLTLGACGDGSDDPTSTPCGSDEDCAHGVCDLALGSCVDCRSDDDCRQRDFCDSGTCLADTCAEGQTRCGSDGQLVTCRANGSGESERLCSDSVCVEKNGAATCVEPSCVPGALACDNLETTVLRCLDDGFSTEVVEHCQANDQVCVDGACAAPPCQPGVASCVENAVVECDESGTLVMHEACANDTRCDAASASCVELACAPRTLTCDSSGTAVLRCGEEGLTAELVEDCQATAQVCVEGACEAPPCEPGVASCVENAVVECDESGTLVIHEACSDDTRCDAASASCVELACHPGQETCIQKNGFWWIWVCNAEGTAPVHQVLCEAYEVCLESFDPVTGYDGSCVEKVCEPDQYFCKNGGSYLCDSSGTQTTPQPSCTSEQYCNGATGRCEAAQ